MSSHRLFALSSFVIKNMLGSILRQTGRVVPRAGRALGAQTPRFVHGTPRAEADSMGSLIDKGKDGAEYVVSGTLEWEMRFFGIGWG